MIPMPRGTHFRQSQMARRGLTLLVWLHGPVPGIGGNGPPEAGKAAVEQPYARTPYLGLQDPRWVVYEKRRKEDPNFEWKTPMAFYGQVVDDSGQPVSDAVVKMEWSGATVLADGSTVGHSVTSSDSHGAFSATGM